MDGWCKGIRRAERKDKKRECELNKETEVAV